MQQQNVWIVERSRLMREALKALLHGSGFEVTCEAPDAKGLPTLRPLVSPPSLIVIAANPEAEGKPTEELDVERLCAAFDVPVVVLADRLSLEHLRRSMRAGASGYVLRDITPDSLKQSMALVLAGEKVLPSELAEFLVKTASVGSFPNRAASSELSDMEKAVLAGLAKGHSNKAIASALDLPVTKVKILVNGLFKKIAAHNRTEAAIWARHRGL